MPGILVVEDDENLNRGITFSLKKSGYEVFSAESVKKAKRIASDNNVDVTICDVNLPDGNGLEFVRWMRCNYNTYIICLTALDQEMDQVMGYEAGADDYITKPFNILEVKARIKAIMRRTRVKEPEVVNPRMITSGDMRIDLDSRRVFISDKEVNLTAKEFDLLELLITNPNKVYNRENLLNLVWGYDYPGDVRTVDVHVRRLREKVEANPSEPRYIHTKWGVGYFFQN